MSTATAIDPTSVTTLRARLHAAEQNRWAGGAAIILLGDGLNAVPVANLTDASYTEEREVITTLALDEIGDLLEMDNAQLLEFISNVRE